MTNGELKDALRAVMRDFISLALTPSAFTMMTVASRAYPAVTM